MEDGSDGQSSAAVILPIIRNGDVSPVMANFPEVDSSTVKENSSKVSECVKVNGDSNCEQDESDEEDSSDYDTLVIDENIKPQRTVKNKRKRLHSKSKCGGFRGFKRIKTKTEIETPSNPYFSESIFDLSQFHHKTHSLPTKESGICEDRNGDDSFSALCKTDLAVSNCKSQTKKLNIKRNKKSASPKLREYAQYLGLQPTVQFKCSKCAQSGFQSLAILNEHLVQCDAQAPVVSPTLTQSSVAPSTNFRVTRKVYLCSACGTYYENWNLFLHMREVHKRFICLYCLGMFSQPEKLSLHLVSKHNCVPNQFKTLGEFLKHYQDPCFLICCGCERVFCERENFFDHICTAKAVEQKQAKTASTGNKNSVNQKQSGKNKQIKNKIVEHVTGDMPVISNSNLSERVEEKESAADIVNINAHEKFDNSAESVCDIPENVHDSSSKLKEESGDVIKSCENDVIAMETSNKANDENLLTELGDNFSNGPESEEINKDEPRDVSRDHAITDTSTCELEDSKILSESDNVMETSGEKDNEDTAIDIIPNKEAPPVLENVVDETIENEELEETRKVPKVTLKLSKTSIYFEEGNDTDDNEKRTTEADQIDGEADASFNVSNENEEFLPSVSENQYPVAGNDIPIVELELEQPLDKFEPRLLLQKCLEATVPTCVYCNHARKISVNGKQLALHAISEHRFSAVVNSITAEELIPESFVARLKESLPQLQDAYLNLESVVSEEGVTFSHVFECFQCRYATSIHKELYLHNRKMHAKTILLCIMCKSNFYSYSELVCHLCPGIYALNNDVSFRCCMCVTDDLPSAFRLMVHLRKRHHMCDVCLELCHNQSRLSNHVWKHKLHHLCYRCGIAYRNKPDITKHLFWKHGTESVLCKKCLQKKWPHVYHFCIPPTSFVCEECNLNFTRAVSLKVHKRLHTCERPHKCTIENCSESFISKKLLLKHEFKHREPPEEAAQQNNEPCTSQNPEHDQENVISSEQDKEIKQDVSESRDERKPKLKPKVDVYDLPALNLSESDSSDDEDELRARKITTDTSNNEEKDSPKLRGKEGVADTGPIPENIEKPSLILENIWDDFKNYQANKDKLDVTGNADAVTNAEECHPSLDVIMNEHDYCIVSPEKDVKERANNYETSQSMDHDYCSQVIPAQPHQKLEESKPQSPPSKKKRSPKKKVEGAKDSSSSSDSSSNSDSSSCTCGSNCSCSSSSDSSSSSSDSSESDSSTSEGRRRQQARRERRKVRAKNKKKESESLVVDVVATDNPSSMQLEVPIQESDLDTTESETDEEFYDKQPQKMASKLLAEKRNQLLMLAGIGPLVNGSVLENSRPSTPSLPDEVKPKKKSKSKKRKKKNRSSKHDEENPEIANIPDYQFYRPPSAPSLALIRNSPLTVPITSPATPPVIQNAEQILGNSAGSGSETDSNLRASKRRRVPNKFYGYSSEEDVDRQHLPPILKWRKADLPSPVRQVNNSPLLVPPITIKTSQPVPSAESAPVSVAEARAQHPLQQTPTIQQKERLQIPQHFPQPSHQDSATESNDSSSDEEQPMPTKANQPALYCYCRCPYDEVSEMIGCDSSECAIEWFHFECVGIMVPPKGQWFCPDCRKKKQQKRDLLQT